MTLSSLCGCACNNTAHGISGHGYWGSFFFFLSRLLIMLSCFVRASFGLEARPRRT